jgi:DNA-binding NarL/FixJ family response regulator
MKRARIVVADDDLYMRLRMNTLLQTDFDVVDAVSDGIALVEAAFRCHPDIIVTDISMPKMNGIEAVRKIRHILPDIKCIFITMHDENIYREKAKGVGASGYVLKSAARDELKQVVHLAMDDQKRS